MNIFMKTLEFGNNTIIHREMYEATKKDGTPDKRRTPRPTGFEVHKHGRTVRVYMLGVLQSETLLTWEL